MSNNKQSNVIWLSSQLFELFEQHIDGNFDRWRLQDLMEKTTEQTKARHKEEIVDANWEASEDTERAEQYYNETFGGNNDKVDL